jgi:uncharacterized protein YabN with tetrapyrrole methylase and pyrophosphatase domain
MNDFYNNVKTDKTSILEINDDDKSASTTDSDRLEFLKLIKKRKLEKQNKKKCFDWECIQQKNEKSLKQCCL